MAPKYGADHGVVPSDNRGYYASTSGQSFPADTPTGSRIGSQEALRLFEIELAKLKQMGKSEQNTNNFSQTAQSHNQRQNNVQK